MKILIISYQFNLGSSVASHRCLGFAKSFQQAGFDVTVLCCKQLSEDLSHIGIKTLMVDNSLLGFLQNKFSKPSKPEPSVKLGFIHKVIRAINNFRASRGILFLGRLPDIAFFWQKQAWKKIMKNGPWDVVLGSFAPYVTLELAMKTQKQGLAKTFIADFRDPWSGHHLFQGLPIFRYIERLKEKNIIKHADIVTTATDGVKDRLASSPKHHLTLYNGFNENVTLFKSTNTEFTIVHTGSLYLHKQNIECFFEAISKAVTILPKIKVLFAGNESEFVNNLAKYYKLTKVIRHLGYLTNKECQNLIANCNIAISFDLNNEHFDGIVPTKLNNYILYKAPILHITKCKNSESALFMKKYPGFYQSSYDRNSIYSSISAIYDKNRDIRKLLEKFDTSEYSCLARNSPLVEFFKRID